MTSQHIFSNLVFVISNADYRLISILAAPLTPRRQNKIIKLFKWNLYHFYLLKILDLILLVKDLKSYEYFSQFLI